MTYWRQWLFIWGFYNYSHTVYKLFILLQISQLHKNLETMYEEPVLSFFSLPVAIGMITYVWYIKNKLYPSAGFFGVKKVTAHNQQATTVF